MPVVKIELMILAFFFFLKKEKWHVTGLHGDGSKCCKGAHQCDICGAKASGASVADSICARNQRQIFILFREGQNHIIIIWQGSETSCRPSVYIFVIPHKQIYASHCLDAFVKQQANS
jgi:hypothetical protein